jgi:hypothetical protein
VARFHALVAERVDEAEEVVIGTETDRGLFFGALVAAGYQVFAVNPKAVDRYRDRVRMAGGKSDAADAKRDPLYRAVFYLFAKTMRAKRGHLQDGGAELGV